MVASEETWLRCGFAALSVKTRVDIVRLLSRFAPSGVEAGAIATSLGISPSNASFHLKELEYAKLIVSRRSGRSIIYAINEEGLRNIVEFLLKLRDGRNESTGSERDFSPLAGDADSLE